MKLRRSLTVSMVAMAFVASGLAAKPKDAKNLMIAHDVIVAGSHLTSGDYSVAWQTHSPEATVTFWHEGKVVATTEGKVEDRGMKYKSNEVVYTDAANGARAIQELRFRGSSEVIVFK